MRKIFVVLTVFLLLINANLSGQTVTQYYDVIHNDKIVGSTMINRVGDEKKFIINLKMTADISFFINRVVIVGKENAVFENSVLKSGSVFRKVNDKVKTDNWIKFDNNRYMLYDGNLLSYLSTGEIRNNMLSLFFNEPVNLKKVYSDNQQKLVELKVSSTNTYSVPGKNQSLTTFVYKDGKCSQVILKNSLITLMFKRTK
ncbi:hypothetical protein NAL32_17350 [Chryseobacterium sp. Ch-15]|uniref:Uncharacterized protein n=1 Tax=Chryseobacterium muglaense TaxID=2893752 RepID=A0A9Q3V0D7_9FLAO|nr:DUF6134 family protein [Chryseobacterium muglaense]MBD3906463.1 hypothetical protein [Chryseobacterium muglaense]MCC9036826.1 hypothetical protein [Chryseobacterium muglaense]MCM2556152.1 hypothetical protein [Chryseobacterium muglaense]